MTTPTIEEYLETILRLSEKDTVLPSAIADAMKVSRPSVTTALRRMEHAQLITRNKTAVELTQEGLARAQAVLRRHRIAELFLVRVLEFNVEDVHEDACRMEHAISDEVLERLEKLLGNPQYCPHGKEIPPKS